MLFLQWSLCYALVALVATVIKSRFSVLRDRVLIMHAGIVVSILCLQFTGASLQWNVTPLAVGMVIGAAFVSILLIGKRGLFYIVSALLQQWCILLAGVLLTPAAGIAVSALATALVFALAHRMPRDSISWKLPLLVVWGVVSLYLYYYLHAPLLNMALHIVGGSALIYRGLLLRSF